MYRKGLTDAFAFWDVGGMKATYSIPEAAKLLGVGRGAAYEAARSGELAGIPVIRIGPKRLVVPRAPLERLLGIETDHDSPTSI